MLLFSHKRFIALLCAFSLCLTACAQQSGTLNASAKDIITQKPTQSGKIPVTVLVKYAFSINGFEEAVEKKFPQLDLIQVGNYTSDRGIVEYARRMEKDDLTDIVMTWPLDVGEEYWDDRLLDLSGMPFTSNYHLSMLNTISRDGKLYYLPGPAQVRGIIYNKTLFEEKGWKVPNNLDEFIALCQTIEASGMRSLQLGFENKEVLDTAFMGFSFGDCFSKLEDVQWVESYNNGNGSIADHLMPALNTFQKMMDAGIWRSGDLEISYAEREQMFYDRECAMTEDSVLMCRMGEGQTGTTDEFALMPFFSSDGSDWARLYMVCYIGLNKHLAEPKNKEKYELVLDVMDYISSPEGQAMLSADTGAMYSSVRGVPPPDVPEIKDLLPALETGRYAIFYELRTAQSALRDGLSDLLLGKQTLEQVIASIDEQNRNPVTDVSGETLGTATENFTLIETGSFIADALREKAGTELALFMDNGMDGRYNGKGVSGKIYVGDQQRSDVLRIFPDLKHNEKGTLQKVQMTGEDLLYTLEYAIPVDNNNTGWFYYFSGLKMTYDPTAQPGSRIKQIADDKGNKIDPQKLYSVAVMDETLPAERCQSVEDTGISIVELLCDTIRSKGSISPTRDGRFKLP